MKFRCVHENVFHDSEQTPCVQVLECCVSSIPRVKRTAQKMADFASQRILTSQYLHSKFYLKQRVSDLQIKNRIASMDWIIR